MEFFKGAKAIRLRSHHEKYLTADDDEEHVSQDRSGAAPSARWTVELADAAGAVIRLRSCHGRYLTASNEPFLFGVTGRKVLQTLPRRLDSSVEWEPLREGFQVRLKTRYGHFLRANTGLPPWRNSVTHDIPHRSAHQDWLLWDVDVVDLHVSLSPPLSIHSSAAADDVSSVSSFGSAPMILDKQESLSYSPIGSPHKQDGRTIYYKIASDNGDVDEGDKGACFTFKGTSVAELKEKLEEATEIQEIFVCSRSPLNGKLYPLRLHLPPNNAEMHVVVVPANSRAARSFNKPENAL